MGNFIFSALAGLVEMGLTLWFEWLAASNPEKPSKKSKTELS